MRKKIKCFLSLKHISVCILSYNTTYNASVSVFCPLLFSVLWLDTLSIPGGQRLSAFGCQNGCVGLALVKQEGPGKDPPLVLLYSI